MLIKIKESDNFKTKYNKLDTSIRIKVKKIILKMLENPEISKPMKYNRVGTRELYIKPFRLSYIYLKNEDKIIYLLDLYHKKQQ